MDKKQFYAPDAGFESRHFQLYTNRFFSVPNTYCITTAITFFSKFIDASIAKWFKTRFMTQTRGFESRLFQFSSNRFVSVPDTYCIIPHNFLRKFNDASIAEWIKQFFMPQTQRVRIPSRPIFFKSICICTYYILYHSA